MCGEKKTCNETDKSGGTDEQAKTEENKGEEEKREKLEIKVSAFQDPQAILRENCRSECQNHVVVLDKCNERVLSKSETKEICFEELIDLLDCVEHCVAHDLFKRLK